MWGKGKDSGLKGDFWGGSKLFILSKKGGGVNERSCAGSIKERRGERKAINGGQMV